MAESKSPDHSLARATFSLARATIIAALIALVGGVLGSRVGERNASEEVEGLEVRMRQQETAIKALQAQLSERDVAISELTEQVARERTRASAALRGSSDGAAVPATINELLQGLTQQSQSADVKSDDFLFATIEMHRRAATAFKGDDFSYFLGEEKLAVLGEGQTRVIRAKAGRYEFHAQVDNIFGTVRGEPITLNLHKGDSVAVDCGGVIGWTGNRVECSVTSRTIPYGR